MNRHLYLSPHLDDAVLSCGAGISRDARDGADVHILTVFAGDEPGAPVSPLVDRVFALWNLPEGRVMASRRAEDREACARLGAHGSTWSELEAIHRLDPATGEPLYGDLTALYGAVAAAEEPLVAAMAERLLELPRADRILAPLGVGGHVDHRLLRLAAERAFGPRLSYYEEYPYVVWSLFALRRARGPLRAWRSSSRTFEPRDVQARIEAIGCYASQVPPLFRSTDRLAQAVRKHVRRAGGERTWQRRDATEGSER